MFNLDLVSFDCWAIATASLLSNLPMGPTHYVRLERLVRDQHFSFLDPFVSYDKIKCSEHAPDLNQHVLVQMRKTALKSRFTS